MLVEDAQMNRINIARIAAVQADAVGGNVQWINHHLVVLRKFQIVNGCSIVTKYFTKLLGI